MNLKIQYWDGNAGTLELLNQTNFQTISNLINKINELHKSDVRFIEHDIELDLKILNKSNRAARNQFLNNAVNLTPVMQDLFMDFKYFSGDLEDMKRQYQPPIIPQNLVILQDEINDYWSAVANNLTSAFNAVNNL